MPFAIITALLVCTVLYIAVSLVLTGMMHYTYFNPQGKYPDAIKAPVAYAFEIAGQDWAGYIIIIAATVGLISVLMVMMMGQSRIFMGMSKDGMIPKLGNTFCFHDGVYRFMDFEGKRTQSSARIQSTGVARYCYFGYLYKSVSDFCIE